jgi:hypothetical protein
MDTQANILEHFLTQAELAAALHKSPRTLKRWAVLRRGPKITRVGKTIYYHRDDVQAWLAGNCQEKR